MDRVAGILDVGRTDDTHEVRITHLNPQIDAQGKVHILVSPRHARHLANLLTEQAAYAEEEAVASDRKIEAVGSADRSKRTIQRR